MEMANQGKNTNRDGSKQASLFDKDIGKDHLGQNYLVNDFSRDQLLLALMSLQSLKGIGFVTLCSMFDSGIVQSLFSLSIDELDIHFSNIQHRQRLELIKAISTNKEAFLETGRKSIEQMNSRGIRFVVKGHLDYPESLLKLQEPPRWLFVQGNVSVLKSHSIIGIVGTRDATIDGQRLAYLCASQLAKKNIVVLSGLAKGIDEKAHLGATDYFGQSIAILGFGLDYSGGSQGNNSWRKILETDGAIVSEYFPNESATKESFLRRNRLQAALSKAVIPVECPTLESGTGATIRRALAIGTPVIGITSTGNGINENHLASTKSNLLKLGCKFFSLQNGEALNFWSYLQEIMPEHSWNADPSERQERFFRSIVEQITATKKRVDLDTKAVDTLAAKLKDALR
jgi:DNA protecting protein DprA